MRAPGVHWRMPCRLKGSAKAEKVGLTLSVDREEGLYMLRGTGTGGRK